MFGVKKKLAGTALKKLRPVHLVLMAVGLLIAVLFGMMAFFPGFVTSFL